MVNVLYMMRVCQFRYGDPLLVLITWIVPVSPAAGDRPARDTATSAAAPPRVCTARADEATASHALYVANAAAAVTASGNSQRPMRVSPVRSFVGKLRRAGVRMAAGARRGGHTHSQPRTANLFVARCHSHYYYRAAEAWEACRASNIVVSLEPRARHGGSRVSSTSNLFGVPGFDGQNIGPERSTPIVPIAGFPAADRPVKPFSERALERPVPLKATRGNGKQRTNLVQKEPGCGRNKPLRRRHGPSSCSPSAVHTDRPNYVD